MRHPQRFPQRRLREIQKRDKQRIASSLGDCLMKGDIGFNTILVPLHAPLEIGKRSLYFVQLLDCPSAGREPHHPRLHYEAQLEHERNALARIELAGIEPGRLGGGADEGTQSLSGYDQTIDLQFGDSFADHGTAYLECFGQLVLAGQPVAGSEIPAENTLAQNVRDLVRQSLPAIYGIETLEYGCHVYSLIDYIGYARMYNIIFSDKSKWIMDLYGSISVLATCCVPIRPCVTTR